MAAFDWSSLANAPIDVEQLRVVEREREAMDRMFSLPLEALRNSRPAIDHPLNELLESILDRLLWPLVHDGLWLKQIEMSVLPAWNNGIEFRAIAIVPRRVGTSCFSIDPHNEHRIQRVVLDRFTLQMEVDRPARDVFRLMDMRARELYRQMVDEELERGWRIIDDLWMISDDAFREQVRARQAEREESHERLRAIKRLLEEREASNTVHWQQRLPPHQPDRLYRWPVGEYQREIRPDNRNAAAEAKGMALLKENLTPEQRESLEKRGYFEVVGGVTGTRYRIESGSAMNVVRLDSKGAPDTRMCFVPKGNLVTGDVMLAQKNALELMEKSALKVAKVWNR